MQEIILLIVIALALFYIPRLRASKTVARRQIETTPPLTGLMRLAILITVLWVAGAAILVKPWNNNNLLSYLLLGIAPAVIFWGLIWVYSGYKKYRR
jgi:hypothetical protein